MNCKRCNGKMAHERFFGPGEPFWGWRCIFCGEISDPTITRNRELGPLLAEEVEDVHRVLEGQVLVDPLEGVLQRARHLLGVAVGVRRLLGRLSRTRLLLLVVPLRGLLLLVALLTLVRLSLLPLLTLLSLLLCALVVRLLRLLVHQREHDLQVVLRVLVRGIE